MKNSTPKFRLWTEDDARTLVSIGNSHFKKFKFRRSRYRFTQEARTSLILEMKNVGIYSKYMYFSRNQLTFRLFKKAALGEVCSFCKSRFPKLRLCVDCIPLPAAKALSNVHKAIRTKKTCLQKYGYDNPSKSPVVIQRIKDVFTERYGEGVTNSMHIEEIHQRHTVIMRDPEHIELVKTRVKESFQKKYGVDHYLQSEQGKRKYESTMVRKHGVRNSMFTEKGKKNHKDAMALLYADEQRVESALAKGKQTNLKRYGYENPFSSPELMEKVRDRREEKYGVRHSLQREECRDKFKRTSLERYGYEHHMHNPQIRRRAEKEKMRTYGYKEVIIGKTTFRVQGYEDFVRDLVSRLEISDIKIGLDLKGFLLDEHTRYYPDFYIRSKKMYIEVKSDWTLLSGHKGDALKLNRYKAERAVELGFKVKWVVAYPKSNLLVPLPEDWYQWKKQKLVRFLEDAKS